jgi:hypothetical protein
MDVCQSGFTVRIVGRKEGRKDGRTDGRKEWVGLSLRI